MNSLRKRMSMKAFITILSLVALFLFQNCAEPLPQEDASTLSVDLPFAFNAQVDTLAFMSCSNMDDSVDKEAYFTFKVGALREGSGLQFRPNFLEYLKKKSSDEVAELLAGSNLNAGVSLQLAVRDRGYFKKQSAYGNQAKGGARFGYEVNNLLAALDTVGIVGGLYNSPNNQPVHYFSNIPGVDNRNLEGAIYFQDLDEGAMSNLFNSRTLLTLNYNLKSAPYFDDPLSDFPDNNDRIYGSGYKIQFGGSNMKVLDRVYEYNLEVTNGEAVEWVCPNHLKYLIAKTAAECPGLSDDPGSNPQFGVVRGILDPEADDWYINESKKCITRKVASEVGHCYGTGTVKATTPQYLSVCYKNILVNP